MTAFTAEIITVAAGDELELTPDDRVLLMGTTGGIGHVTRASLLVLRKQVVEVPARTSKARERSVKPERSEP